MDRCSDLCTKDTIGTCALCEARAEADRFLWFWFKGGLCSLMVCTRCRDSVSLPYSTGILYSSVRSL